MTNPLLANTNPTFAPSHATRILIGNVIVTPTPTACP